MDSRKYIGMDVHQASISVAVRDGVGKLTMGRIIETKAATILEFLGGQAEFGSPRATLQEIEIGAREQRVRKPLI